jgi:hypothetical protein
MIDSIFFFLFVDGWIITFLSEKQVIGFGRLRGRDISR